MRHLHLTIRRFTGSAAPSSVRTTHPKPSMLSLMRRRFDRLKALSLPKGGTHLRYLLLLLVPALLTAGSDLPQQIQHQGQSYQKLGEDRYFYKRIFKVYDAALYTENDASLDAVLSADCAFKLKFSYLRDIDKSLAIEAADKALQKNLSATEIAEIADRVETINDAYKSVTKGDQTMLHYQPGIGTTYSFNGKPLITIPGQDFAKLYFTVWLGEQPLSASLRDALLGKS